MDERRRAPGRALQAKKRATFPLINSKIIVAADTGDLALLVSTIEANLDQMNLVNLSTAFHRLAKLTAGDPATQAALRQHSILEGLLFVVRVALERAETNGAPPQCQALSNITWSLATIGFSDLPLLVMTAELATRHVDHFKPFELSSTIWAYAKLGGLQPDACHCAGPLFAASAAHIIPRVKDFTFRCLVMVAHAFALASHHDETLFRVVADHMLPGLGAAKSQELSDVAWSYSRAGIRHDRLFAEIARRGLEKIVEFRAQDLAQMLSDLAGAGFFDGDLFERALVGRPSTELQARHLVQVAVALPQACLKKRKGQVVVLAIISHGTRLIETFSVQELVALALIAAKSFGAGGSAAPISPVVSQFFAAALPFVTLRLREFSGRALAHVLISFLAVQVGSNSELFPAIGCEVLGRAPVLDSVALLLMLRFLPMVPRGACNGAACVLFHEAARRIDTLPIREWRELSTITSRLLALDTPALSREELQRCCTLLAQAAPIAGAASKAAEDDLALVLAETPIGDAWVLGTWEEEQSVGAQGLALGGSGRPPGAWPRSQAAAAQAKSTAPISVKNTFVHVVDTVEPRLDSARLLPPPLDIIPASVSEEKLAAFRSDYQNFRAGNAVGAKGEVSDSVLLHFDSLDLSATAGELAAAARRGPNRFSASPLHGPPLRPPAFGFAPFVPPLGGFTASVPRGMTITAPSPPGMEGPEFIHILTGDSEVARRLDLEIAEDKREEILARGSPPSSWHAQVKNTFVHIGGRGGAYYEEDLTEEPVKPLPPPLDIPPAVSEEKLATYRMEYQQFRTGKAFGSRGEVACSVAADLDLATGDEALALAWVRAEAGLGFQDIAQLGVGALGASSADASSAAADGGSTLSSRQRRGGNPAQEPMQLEPF